LAKTKARAGSEAPESLNFHSWWFEESVDNGLIRKHVIISFRLKERDFVIRFKGREDSICISHLCGRTGVLSELDLHVGLSVDVLGRPLTLKQPVDQSTLQWLEGERRRLLALRRRLASELGKYQLDFQALANVYRSEEPGAGRPGGVPLRKFKKEVEELYRLLTGIRPAVAKRIEEEMGH
jgi:hypothetical protein